MLADPHSSPSLLPSNHRNEHGLGEQISGSIRVHQDREEVDTRPVAEDSSRFSDGPFYVSWYDGKKKQFEAAGRDPEHALRMVTLKRAALA